MSNNKPIRHVQHLDPLASKVVAAPTKELESRLRILENAINNIARKGAISNVIIQNRNISSDVELYHTVYYNTASGLYEPALARVEFDGATFKSMPSSLVIGIVVKIVGTTADILVDGMWPASIFKNEETKLLEPGETYQAGKPYYLSSDYEGRLTFRPPALAMQVMMSADDSILMNKSYGNPEGFEKAAKFEMGMRPIGSLRTVGEYNKIVGFNALESDSLTGEWTSTKNNATFSESGYMVAEGTAVGLMSTPFWVELLIDTSGVITANTASSLAQLETPDIRSETFSTYAYEADDIPFAVSVENHTDVRSYMVRDRNNNPVLRIKFKFVTSDGEDFTLNKYRSVIFKLPDSFMGWKELTPSALVSGEDQYKYQIQPYYEEDTASDYEDFEHIPLDSSLYYATRGDFGFVQNWPSEPLSKSIVVINGVEMSTSELVENGDASHFESSKYDMGVSLKTLYWPTSFLETSPWTLGYESVIKLAESQINTDAAITHRSANSGYFWCWQEDLNVYEPSLNKGWVYTNKLSIYSKSTRVLGLGVMPPFKMRDMITGLEPSYPGEPLGGNLLIWSEDKDNVLAKVQDVDIGRFSTQILYTNDTKFNVVVKDITFIVKSQNNAQLSNQQLGQVFTEDDYALVDVGTGVEAQSVYNIFYRAQVKVREYNTSCVLTADKESAVVPPNGVVRLSVYRPFDVEQTVSVIFSGRTI
jgi:hypothetical protein